MMNLHGLWMSCLHCPIVFILGVCVALIAFSAFLVSAAAACCTGQADRPTMSSETMRSASGCDSDVPHVVF